MEWINKQLDFTIDGCAASLIVNNGFINSSGASPGNLHCHPFYEIHFVLRGENDIRHQTGTLKADTGDIVIIPPGMSHCFIPVGYTGEQKRAAFWIDVRCDAEVGREDSYVFKRIHELKSITRIKDPFNAMRTVEEIQRELIERKACYEENLIHIFSKLMILICRSIEIEEIQDVPVNKSHQSRMLLIEEYILRSYKGKCTIEGLSEHLHISRRQLTRLIRSLFSKNFREMLLEMRMSMANWLIEDKNLPFETVASEVGYSSLPAFYHAYSDFYGLTPGTYRKQSNPVVAKDHSPADSKNVRGK